MATRIYLPSSGAAAISPAFAAGWGSTGSAARVAASRTRSGTALASTSVAETSTATIDVLVRQYVLGAGLAAQTISGTILGVIRVAQSVFYADFRAQIVVKVVSSDGLTLRGTLVDFDAGALDKEFPLALSRRGFPRNGTTTILPTAINPVDAQDGDRIVFEIGYRAHNSDSVSCSATFRFGDSAGTDLTAAEGFESDYNPWIEFSQTLAFAGEDVAGEVALDAPAELDVAATVTAFGAAALDNGESIAAQGAEVADVAVLLDGGPEIAAAGAGQVFAEVALDGVGDAAVFGIQSRTGLSATAVASAMAQETGEAWLLLLTIDHSSLAEPIRVAANHENVTSRGDVYVGYPFSIDLPDDAPNEMPRVRLEIDNVGVPNEADPGARRVSDYLRAIAGPFTVTIEVVLASQPDVVEAGPFPMTCAKAEYDAGTVSAELIFEDVLNEPYPAGSFVPASHPGLF